MNVSERMSSNCCRGWHWWLMRLWKLAVVSMSAIGTSCRVSCMRFSTGLVVGRVLEEGDLLRPIGGCDSWLLWAATEYE